MRSRDLVGHLYPHAKHLIYLINVRNCYNVIVNNHSLLQSLMYVNCREYRRGNQKWTIQRNWQDRVHNAKKTATHYVLDTTMRKQTQIT